MYDVGMLRRSARGRLLAAASETDYMTAGQINDLAPPTRANLLKEYEICQQAAQALENAIWQSATVLGLGSAAGLILTLSQGSSLHVIALVGTLVITGSFAWWRIARRWWSIQYSKFTRMLHIEAQLRYPGQVSYLRYLDDLSELVAERTSQKGHISRIRPAGVPRRSYEIPASAAKDLHRLNCRDFERRGPREVLENLPWVSLFVWVGYFLIEMIRAAS